MIVIIDCQLGNLRNVQKAFERIGLDTKISNNIEDIQNADGYILPGVGAFGSAMEHLHSLNLVEPLRHNIMQKKKPILGICLGMQILGERGFEDGEHKGLGILPMTIQKLNTGENLPLPHIGWNNIEVKSSSILFEGIPPDADVYFVHSYHAVCNDNEIVAATSNYGTTFVAAIEKDNVFATQFHPEKSQAYGVKILENFANYCRSNSCDFNDAYNSEVASHD